MDIRLDGKVVIVTGGSRGIGAAIAYALAACGANVTVTARDAAALEAVSQRIESDTGARALAVARDLREPDAAAAVVEQSIAAFGRLDILVNNAGATKRGDFLTLSDDDYLDGFALKFHAAVRFCRAAWPHLRASSGSIVNIAGVGANTPSADFTIGGPVNAAVLNFTKALADRGLTEGIRINAINPGHIITDRLHRRVAALAQAEGITIEEAHERSRQEAAVERFGESREIASVVAFLCSEHGSYVHGVSLDVDGGTTRGI